MRKSISVVFLLSLVFQPAWSEPENEDPHYWVYLPNNLFETVHDAPAATTILTSSDIKKLGIVRIEDIFKLVPGMSVLRGDSNVIKVAYHATSSENPRRMLIKVNGTTVPYHQNLQWVRWEIMPFSMDDIEKVEIVRSPSNATHGGNAAQGVINFVLVDPELTSSRLAVQAGSQNHGELHLRKKFGDTENGASYFNIGYRQNDGYDEDFMTIEDRSLRFTPFDSGTVTREWMPAHDEYKTLYGGLHANYIFGKTEFVNDIYFSSFDNTNRTVVYGHEFAEEVDPAHSNETELTGSQWFITSKASHNVSDSLELSGYISISNQKDRDKWTDCRYLNFNYFDETYNAYAADQSLTVGALADILTGQFNPGNYTPLELSILGPLAGRVGSNVPAALSRDICGEWDLEVKERRYSGQFDLKYHINENMIVDLGVGGQRETLSSQVWYDGDVSENRQHLSINVSSYFGPLTTNMGFYTEHFSLNDDTYTSPRMAISYKMHDYYSLKIIHAISHSDPPIFARKANWTNDLQFSRGTINGESQGRHFWQAIGNEDVTAEKIKSTSVVFSYQKPGSDLSYDISIFREDMDDLIPSLYDWILFNPDNSGSLTQKGIEGELRYSKGQMTSGATYSYIDNDSTNDLERSLYSKIIYSGYVAYTFMEVNTLSLFVHHNEIVEVDYDELNLNFTRLFHVNSNEISLSARFTYYPNAEHVKTTKRLVESAEKLRTIKTRYDDKLQAVVSLAISF